MRKWTMTAGLLFSAAAAVYSSQASGANPAKPTRSATGGAAPTDVTLLEETVDPFGPSEQPSTQPVQDLLLDPAEAPPSQLMMNSDGTFSLNIVSGASVVEQLRVIGFQAQMSIIPSKEVRGTLPAIDLYNVTVSEALDALLHANGYAWRQKGNFVYVYTAKEVAEMEKASRIMNTRVFRLFYTPAANAANMIKPVLSTDAQVSLTTAAVGGIASGVADVGGNSHATDDMLVITDYPEHLDRVQVILSEVDKRPQQILIEATILRAALTEDNALGVDFNIVGGVDFSTITTNNGQINSANTASPISPDAHSVGTGNAFSDGIGGLKVGVVTNNVSIFLSALEGVTDTVVLANPKVLALNKQKGEVIVGRRDGYITTTVTETTATQTVEFLDTGTRLIFRPYIGSDGFIRMEIHPEDSSGGVNAQGLPFKATTEVTSNVMVKDGHTIVIGGLFRESTDSAKSQIPVLGNIPVAGYLFRQQRDKTVREEVIIMLTPHIIKDDSAYSQLSEQQMKAAEQLRVGARRGLMPFGRERLADMYYHAALKELDRTNPDRKKAIFYLDAATGLNPTFREAINLKQELTGREVTASDGSSIRSFVKQAVMVDLPAPTTQPMAEVIHVPTTPATQPNSEKGRHAMPPMEPITALPAPSQPTVMPSVKPMDELSLTHMAESSDGLPLDCEFGPMGGYVEVGMEPAAPILNAGMPATNPTQPLLVLTPEQLSGPSTQPSSPSKFGVTGLTSSFGDLFKMSGEEDAPRTTVTDAPMQRLDD